MTNINIEELKKREAFKVPEHYFDTLTERVMANIPAEEETNVITISKKKTSNNWWKWSSVAASIAIVAIGTALIFNRTDETTKSIEQFANNTEEISQEEIMEYTMLDGEDVYCYLSGEDY